MSKLVFCVKMEILGILWNKELNRSKALKSSGVLDKRWVVGAELMKPDCPGFTLINEVSHGKHTKLRSAQFPSAMRTNQASGFQTKRTMSQPVFCVLWCLQIMLVTLNRVAKSCWVVFLVAPQVVFFNCGTHFWNNSAACFDLVQNQRCCWWRG